jgi:dipeptidase E
MTRIIAISGGEIGRKKKRGYAPCTTIPIDKEIINATGKKHPKLLFFPTASSDSESYVATIEAYFGKKLGCSVDVLYLTKNPTKKEIVRKIQTADIIYVGGGNTLKLMNLWKNMQ